MAKKRRLSESPAPERAKKSDGMPRLQPLLLATGLLGGAIVYVSYHPSDSVSVEKGDALWFSALSIVIATVTCVQYIRRGANQDEPSNDKETNRNDDPVAWVTTVLDIGPWLLGIWMMIAAVASCPPGNLRMATSEAWLWIAGAAVFTASRRLTQSISARRALLMLMVVCASGLAIHGLHQQFVSLEQTREAYRQNPERVLRMVGIDAPEGSAERMVFENRLKDGGPTGTFALANSLAAVLLVGVVAAFGVLRLHWPSFGTVHRVVWIALLLLCGGCLLAARSRSALLAAIIGIALTWLLSSRLRDSSRRVVISEILVVVLIAVIVGIGISAVGNPEWFEQAPASLSFRFQYWRSTIALVSDSPVWGSGPGNFQSMYERYRDPSMHEQVAEPHNFFFETLASGGIVAVGLLAAIVICGIVFFRSHEQREGSETAPTGDESNQWVWLGAGLGLVLVWLLGFASSHTPDLDANVFVVPAVVAVGVLLSPSLGSLGWREIDSISLVTLTSLLVHLSFAGGLTVPGVAVSVWMLSAILTRVGPQSVLGSGSVSTRSRANFITVLGMSALAAIWFVSIRPVELSTRAMAKAETAQTRRLQDVKQSLEQAMQADRWSPAAAIWLADYYRWQLIIKGDDADLRQDWESNLAEVRRRAGDDPAVYRLIGGQQLHLYQRFGQQADLDAAMATFSTVVSWAPSDESSAAQLAEIAEALDREELSVQYAKKAKWLSEQGGNIERALERHQIYVARPIGSEADEGPVRRSAGELLSNQLDKTGVASQTE